ncbi:MAG TPA: hypothetical protein PLO51_02840 [Candidatus Micrarchaeota archaeon]|nr:hypothetical protein [Candidatus Micrarchaeota archaeon]
MAVNAKREKAYFRFAALTAGPLSATYKNTQAAKAIYSAFVFFYGYFSFSYYYCH